MTHIRFMKSLLFFGVFFLVISSIFAQKQNESTEKRMRLREEMHYRLMNKLLNGIGSDTDLFSDMEQMMDEAFKESFSSGGFSSSFGNNKLSMNWKENDKGRILEISPVSSGEKMDINVINGMIQIQGKTEIKSESGTSYSQYSNSFSVPTDCDGGKVKMESIDGKIVLFFPYKTIQEIEKKPPNKLKPVEATEEDVRI